MTKKSISIRVLASTLKKVEAVKRQLNKDPLRVFKMTRSSTIEYILRDWLDRQGGDQ